jgi:6-phosphofructokinase 1
MEKIKLIYENQCTTPSDINEHLPTLLKYAKEKNNITLTIRYLNPTYAIRTAPANGRDTNLCHRLAHSAVHSV